MKFTDRPVSPQDSAAVLVCLGMTTMFFLNVVELFLLFNKTQQAHKMKQLSHV